MLQNTQLESDKRGKQEGRGQQCRRFGGIRWAIHMVWRKRCSPAPFPKSPVRRPGERVGRGIALSETTARPPVAQRAGGIPYLCLHVHLDLCLAQRHSRHSSFPFRLFRLRATFPIFPFLFSPCWPLLLLLLLLLLLFAFHPFILSSFRRCCCCCCWHRTHHVVVPLAARCSLEAPRRRSDDVPVLPQGSHAPLWFLSPYPHQSLVVLGSVSTAR